MPDKTAHKAWLEARTAVELALMGASFKNWIEPLEAIGVDEDNKLVLAGRPNVVKWSAKRYGGFIQEAIRRETDYAGVTFRAYRTNGDTTEVRT